MLTRNGVSLSVAPALGVLFSALLVAEVQACGGAGAGQVAGVAAAVSAGNSSAAVAATVAATVAGQATAAAGTPVGVSVAGVSAGPNSVSMSVDVTVGEGDWRRVFRRFIVLPVGMDVAKAKPNSLAVALSATVGRMLIEDVAQRLSGNAALAASLRKAAERVTALTEADFRLSPS